MKWTTDNTKLNDERFEGYESQGYTLLGRILTDDGLAAAQNNLDRMLEVLHPDLAPYEIYSAHQLEPWLLDLSSCNGLLDPVERVLGPDIVLWSTHLICKPPGSGRHIPWHQDGTYWNVAGRMTSIWVALDDVDDENGTMYVLPGYHKQILSRRDTGETFFNEEIHPSALPLDVEDHEAEYKFPAGGAAMHHVMIPHRSPPNRCPDRWRRVLVVRYMSVDGEMGAKEYPDYRSGIPFTRQFILVRGENSTRRNLIPLSDFRSVLEGKAT